jgi:hypothetical protein
MTLTRAIRSLTGVFFLSLVGCQATGSGGAGTAWKVMDAEHLAVHIDCRPEGAEVRVDGVLQGTCQVLSRPEVAMKLAAGSHELEVAADGYRSFRSIVSGKGIRESLTVRLVPCTPRTPSTAE